MVEENATGAEKRVLANGGPQGSDPRKEGAGGWLLKDAEAPGREPVANMVHSGNTRTILRLMAGQRSCRRMGQHHRLFLDFLFPCVLRKGFQRRRGVLGCVQRTYLALNEFLFIKQSIVEDRSFWIVWHNI